MTHLASESLGWAATGVFVASYFVHPARMRAAQMLGALLWLAYGVGIGSSPVIVANVLVFSAAAWTTFRKAPAERRSL
jgi:Bacterial inner membrane protein